MALVGWPFGGALSYDGRESVWLFYFQSALPHGHLLRSINEL